MNKDNDKISRATLICAMIAILMSIVAVCAYRNSKVKTDATLECVFDGWVYGLEDQKRASVALGAAGLNDYSWDDGQLKAPREKLSVYRSALANAGAYPKAPGQERVDAMREMSAFESESKTRLRELNACATQLERTIEQMRGVAFATVGVRARPERVGFSNKNVVTASVGVAFKNGYSLDANALSAITIATKHQLGISGEENISILDLREGKSYIGAQTAVTGSGELQLGAEKERVEKYWRDKYLDALDNIPNVRVAVVVELTRQGNDAFARYDGHKRANSMAYAFDDALVDANVFSNVPSVDISEVGGNSALAMTQRGYIKSAHDDAVEAQTSQVVVALNGGAAQLGAPQRSRGKRLQREFTQHINPDANVAPANYTAASPRRSYVAVPAAGERSNSFNPIVSAMYEEEPREPQSAKIAPSATDLVGALVDMSIDAMNAPETNLDTSSNGTSDAHNDHDTKPANVQTGNNNANFKMRSISVHIALPRSYIVRVARQAKEKNSAELTEEFYALIEDKILRETKQFAIDLFRPTSEKLGWLDSDLARWFVVDVFSDVDSLADAQALSIDHDVVDSVSNYLQTAPIAESEPFATTLSDVNGAELELGHNLANALEGKTVSAHCNELNEPYAESVAPDIATSDVSEENGAYAQAQDADDSLSSQLPTPSWREYFTNTQRIVRFLRANWTWILGLSVAFYFIVKCLVVITERFRGDGKNNVAENERNSTQNDRRQALGKDASARRVQRRLKTESKELTTRSVSSRRTTRSEASRESGARVDERNDLVKDSDIFEDLDSYDDELDDELMLLTQPETVARRSSASTSSSNARASDAQLGASPDDEFLRQRRVALERIANYPERAAQSLQRWVKRTN
ncbi:MAG: hypothetical protein Q4G03_03265 [Planctomycetia bacterium]|nr:hypothetical protein [Planctomycetia bacterium]